MNIIEGRDFIVPDSIEDLEDESGTMKLNIGFDLSTDIIQSKFIDKDMSINFDESVKRTDKESTIRIIETKKIKDNPLW